MVPPAVRFEGARAREANAATVERAAPLRVEQASEPPLAPPRAAGVLVSRSRARALLMVFLN
jgi:hypothetical protein